MNGLMVSKLCVEGRKKKLLRFLEGFWFTTLAKDSRQAGSVLELKLIETFLYDAKKLPKRDMGEGGKRERLHLLF